MSLHSSLRIDTAGAQQRTVLTRIERIKELMKKGLWKDSQSVTGLPKTKIVKIKARKTKEEAAPAAATATATASATAAKASENKAAKPAKSAK